MKITCLIENTSVFSDYRKEEGLSLYISTDRHRILFDSGCGSGFRENAEKLGVDLQEVDVAFISHGHYDHGGGLEEFMQINAKAPIYVQRSTFGLYYARKNGRYHYGGLDQKLAENPRFRFLDGPAVIDDQLRVIAAVPPKKEIKNLFMKEGGKYLLDTFAHEQSLVISEDGLNVLISGCSHCGIDRILAAAREACGKIDYLLGGFHLIAYDFQNPADLAEIDALAEDLLAQGTVCTTCHCTSTQGYSRLKRTMGEQVSYLSTGETIHLAANTLAN